LGLSNRTVATWRHFRGFTSKRKEGKGKERGRRKAIKKEMRKSGGIIPYCMSPNRGERSTLIMWRRMLNLRS